MELPPRPQNAIIYLTNSARSDFAGKNIVAPTYGFLRVWNRYLRLLGHRVLPVEFHESLPLPRRVWGAEVF